MPAPNPRSGPAAPGAQTDLQRANAEAAAQQIAFFRAIPWCAAHLVPSLSLIIDQGFTRRLTGTLSDTLLSRTLNTPDAIPAYITFFHRPPPPDATSKAGGEESGSGSVPPPVREVRSLFALGPMVNGWDGVCHGGVVVTLLDEVMGQVFGANRKVGCMPREQIVMTGCLNTRYERPLHTGTVERPAVVLVTARVVRSEGRKHWLEAEATGEGGVVFARADAVFVVLKGKL